MADKGRSDDRLAAYESRRDFDLTPEPERSSDGQKPGERPRFVIQHHEASSEHYDLRLEVDGVLTSWAVPKGPSTDPREKRLAVITEDHPLDYVDFEGTIPPDSYGAGRVIVWDTGTYRNLNVDDGGNEVAVADGVEQGHVAVWLEGDKLRGGYALTRFRGDDQWLLVKMDDEGADARRRPTSTQPRSVRSGRTLEDLPEPADADGAA